MKHLMICLIVANTLALTAYSQNAEIIHSKEIKGYLLERNECVDLYRNAMFNDSILTERNQSLEFSNELKLNQIITREEMYNECANDNFICENELSEKTRKVKTRNIIIVVETVIILLAVAIVLF